MNGCGMEAVSFSGAKDTSEQPGQLLIKELKMTAPNSLSQVAKQLKTQTILSLQVNLET